MATQKIRICFRILIFLLLMSMAVINLSAQFAGGDGSSDNPYQINSTAHLELLRNYLGDAHTDKHFIQTAHIDVGGIPNWIPISEAATNRFHGKYNGGNFEIRNLRRGTSLNNFGFFGYTGAGCVLENIKLRDVVITVNQHSGALVAQAADTEIRNCSVTSTINTLNNIQGGIVGSATGNTNIYRSWVNVRMTDGGSAGNTGGIVGQFNSAGSISECFALVELSSAGINNPCAAGLVARLMNGSLNNSYAIGSIRSTQPRGTYGGLVGANNNRPISNSFAIVQYRNRWTRTHWRVSAFGCCRQRYRQFLEY